MLSTWYHESRSYKTHAVFQVLILYEHALTFSEEVSLFWGRKATVVTAFFFANRYSTVLYGVLNLTSGFVGSDWVSRSRQHALLARYADRANLSIRGISTLCRSIRIIADSVWLRRCIVLTRLTQVNTLLLMLMFGGKLPLAPVFLTPVKLSLSSVVVLASACAMAGHHLATCVCVWREPRAGRREHCALIRRLS